MGESARARTRRDEHGFVSMLELGFLTVVLGILAAIALAWYMSR